MQVELFDHPHVLLLQVRNSSFVLPGGRLRPGEEGRCPEFLLLETCGLAQVVSHS